MKNLQKCTKGEFLGSFITDLTVQYTLEHYLLHHRRVGMSQPIITYDLIIFHSINEKTGVKTAYKSDLTYTRVKRLKAYRNYRHVNCGPCIILCNWL